MDMNEVVEYYLSTVDGEHPEGNMMDCSSHFGITRAKVHKILITMEAVDSPLHQDVVKLKGEGYSNDDIARILGVSSATVSINLPYEKVMYKEEEKSRGARDTENFRKREKVFLAGQTRRPTNLEAYRRTLSPEDIAESEKRKKEMPEDREDLLNLHAVFSDEERKLFHSQPNVIVLHIELMGNCDCEVLRKYGGVKYGESISRDVLVSPFMPLHNLHYLIQQIFGFLTYHLHDFRLPDESLEILTGGEVDERWLSLMGYLFKNPLRSEDADFWDDDYEGGSQKKYMRSKYTGPYDRMCPEERYLVCRKDAARIRKIIEANKDRATNPWTYFEMEPFALRECLTIFEVLDIYDDGLPSSYEEYWDDISPLLPGKNDHDEPFVFPAAKELVYTYDYGDDWEFRITPHTDVEYLLKDGRIRLSSLREDIKYNSECLRPVLLASDGYNPVEDVGGASGYCAFLCGINGEDCGPYPYDDVEESRAWAHSLGWKEKVPSKTIV